MNISYFYTCKGIFPRELLKWTLHTQKFSHPNKVFNIRTYCDKKPSMSLPGWRRYKLSTTRNYVTALGLLTLAGAYAAVPLYRIFCQASGYGGTTRHDLGGEKIERMVKKPYRKVLVTFTSDVSTELQWKFEPQQRALEVVPGETALAFYTATNPLDKPVIGISTYNVLPFEAGPYFNKIQCFCFEEQQLNPKEQVDMPVFFYIDPEFCEDPAMENVNEIILSYTFFQAKEGMSFSSIFSKSKN